MPPVLPSGDDAAWIALIHAHHQAHMDIMAQATSHIQHLIEQFIVSAPRTAICSVYHFAG